VTRAVLGLGANLGDVAGALRTAVVGLAAHPGIEVVAVSGLWRTAAVGGPEQPDYLNAVVLVSSTIAPEDLLAVVQGLERAAGRERTVRWGARTLDVDLLDVEGVRSDRPELTLPHPRAHERAFVLAPWAQVDPDWVLEPAGRAPAPVRVWRDAIADQQVTLLDEGPWWR
jgi:dihydroneopterin aldolase/2-amino-4-hydroxy-6-hydroxymethyldihydropteridine diphosphokinase